MSAPLTVRAYIGLGSNLDDPRAQVLRACAELSELPDTQFVARSSLYRSAPLGGLDQPDYINAVAALDTRLGARPLLTHLRGIEDRHGRVRSAQRWASRTLDLDLLLYGDAVFTDHELVVPHPAIAERAFVLYPLAELAPELAIPGHGALATLLARCPYRGIERLDSAA